MYFCLCFPCLSATFWSSAFVSISPVCQFPSAISRRLCLWQICVCLCTHVSNVRICTHVCMVTVLLTPYCRTNVHARTTQIHQRRRLHLPFPHGPHDLSDAPWYLLEQRKGRGWGGGLGRRTRAHSSASTQAVLVQPVTWVPQRYVQAQTHRHIHSSTAHAHRRRTNKRHK